LLADCLLASNRNGEKMRELDTTANAPMALKESMSAVFAA
jgi:hypothetical protein